MSVFEQWIQLWKFCKDLLFHQPGVLENAGRLLCGIFGGGGRTLVFLEALHLSSLVSSLSLKESGERKDKKETLHMETGGFGALLESKEEETSPSDLSLGGE